MVAVKGRFTTNKERNRRKQVSQAATQKWCVKRIENDHDYSWPSDSAPSSSSQPRTTPDISYVACEEVVENDNDWKEGRRVVELKVLADALSSCKKCGVPLHLCHSTSIRSYGLAAIIKVFIFSIERASIYIILKLFCKTSSKKCCAKNVPL